MAKIIQNLNGRRTIRLSTDDVICIVREYQNIIQGSNTYKELRSKLNNCELYLPEDVF